MAPTALAASLERLWQQARLARHALAGMMHSDRQVTADDLDLLYAVLLDVDQRITALRESSGGAADRPPA